MLEANPDVGVRLADTAGFEEETTQMAKVVDLKNPTG